MKSNFIIPSWDYWKEPTRAQPLTQMYLATILEDATGDKVGMIDLRDGPKDIPKSDVFFYTVASPDMREVTNIVQGLRKSQPHAKHIAGGPHPTLFPHKSSKVFDSIIIGQGEEAIVKAYEDAKNDELGSKYQIPSLPDATFPFPRRNFLPRDKIVTSLFKTEDVPSTTVLFSHGCPFSCSFCANYNKGPIKRRSNESIGEEIAYLQDEFGIEGLSLQDEICIPFNPKDAQEWADNISKFNIKWRGQIRAGVKREIIDMAKDSGCVELSIGLESVVQDVIDKTGKKIKVKQAEETLQHCKDAGIKTRLYLLNGLPGEPEDVVVQTIDFLERTNPDIVLLSSLQPYPGSDIARNPKKYGMNWVSKSHWNMNHLRCRFGEDEDISSVVPFRYETGLPRRRIFNNLLMLQEFLRHRGKNK